MLALYSTRCHEELCHHGDSGWQYVSIIQVSISTFWRWPLNTSVRNYHRNSGGCSGCPCGRISCSCCFTDCMESEEYKAIYRYALYCSAYLFVRYSSNAKHNVTQSIFSVAGRINSPPEVSTVVTMPNSPSYSTLEGGPIMQPNPAYMKTSCE